MNFTITLPFDSDGLATRAALHTWIVRHGGEILDSGWEAEVPTNRAYYLLIGQAPAPIVQRIQSLSQELGVTVYADPEK